MLLCIYIYIAAFFGKSGYILQPFFNGDKRVNALWYTKICLPNVVVESRKELRKSHHSAPGQSQITQCFVNYQLFQARKKSNY